MALRSRLVLIGWTLLATFLVNKLLLHVATPLIEPTSEQVISCHCPQETHESHRVVSDEEAKAAREVLRIYEENKLQSQQVEEGAGDTGQRVANNSGELERKMSNQSAVGLPAESELGKPKPHSLQNRTYHRVFLRASSIEFPMDISKSSNKINHHTAAFVVMWILTAVDNTDRRTLARRVWARNDLYTRYNVTVQPIFVVGLSNSSVAQEQVQLEAAKHKDIVQINVIDSYANLVYKSVAGLLWTKRRYGTRATFMKCDDDALILPDRMARWLTEPAVRRASRTMFGYAETKAITLREGKYAISEEEWPKDKFANATLQGMGYFITGDLLRDVMIGIQKRPLVWIEDAFITGIIREDLLRAGKVVKLVDMKHRWMKKCKDMRRSSKSLRLAMRVRTVFLLGHWYE